MRPKLGREDAVERGRIAAALQMPEHNRSHLPVKPAAHLSSDQFTNATKPHPPRVAAAARSAVAPGRRGNLLEPAASSTRSRGGGSIGGISGGSMAAMLTVVKPAVPASSGDGSSISGDAGLPWEPFWNRLPP